MSLLRATEFVSTGIINGRDRERFSMNEYRRVSTEYLRVFDTNDSRVRL